MSTHGFLRHLLWIAAVLLPPAMVGATDKAPSRGSELHAATQAAGVTSERPERADEKVACVTLIARMEEILRTLEDEAEEYRYDALFLSPSVEPVQGWLAMPAEDFTRHTERVVRIAQRFRDELRRSRAAPQAIRSTADTAETVAFCPCTKGMDEVAVRMQRLHFYASRVSTSRGHMAVRDCIEERFFDRTLAEVRALCGSCRETLERGNLLCHPMTPLGRQTQENASLIW